MTQTARLTASDPTTEYVLGESVAISGNTIVVGSTGLGTGFVPGVYVYVKPFAGWANMTQTAILTASDSTLQPFGLAISGNTIVGGGGGGTANYVFVKPAIGWVNMTQTAELTASTDAAIRNLAGSVAIDGDTIAASAFQTIGHGYVGVGVVAIYVKPAAGWTNATQNAVLSSTDEIAPLSPAAISGNTVAAGDANAMSNGEIVAGEVHVFVEPAGGWKNMTQTAILTGSDSVKRDDLGWSVAISGSTIVAGAPNKSVGNYFASGALYVYTEPTTGWANMTETTELDYSEQGGSLGWGVAINGSSLVGTRPFVPGNHNTYQGSAEVYQQ